MERFEIRGVVREAESGIGVEGLVVRAYDKDTVFDDLMGEAITIADGSFCIISEGKDFQELLDRRPDIYLRIYIPGKKRKEIYNTKHAVRWNGDVLEYFCVDLPASAVEHLPQDEHDDDHTHDHDHEHESSDTQDKAHCDHACHKPAKPTRIKKCRNIYLKIEKLPAYSPVAPDDAEHDKYRLDCMRNTDHEDGHIPESEVERRRLDALVYREYRDHHFTIPKNDPLISADINEPRADRRIPGTVIYASPGERLFIHVCNADDEPHSFHVHGLVYGIDSDGSWPFGVKSADGRRSDAICPGQSWCYVYDVTHDTVGAWPFHDHHMHIGEAVDRGLFGGIVVRDPHCPKADYEVPLFFHRLVPEQGNAAFDSGTLNGGDIFTHTFTDEGTFNYHCRFHPMTGVVRVIAAGPMTANITILDGPVRFEPNDVTIGVGGTVTWTHAGTEPHTVTEAGGAGLESYAFNGRTFIGNTPTVVARSGKRIRWYIFNLDLSAQWHNFHVHGQRFRIGDEVMDTRSLGPAESFVADTIVPPVILLPLKGECKKHHHHRDDKPCGCGEQMDHHRLQRPRHTPVMTLAHHAMGAVIPAPTTHQPAGQPAHHAAETEPVINDVLTHRPRRVRLQGDFLVHCHIEMHMMQGMACIVRAIQDVSLTAEMADALGFELPRRNALACPDVSLHPCTRVSTGTWERIPDSPIFVVHAALLHTGKVLLWSGTAEVGDPLESRVWDPTTGTMTTQTYTVDLFCAGHAFLPDGRLCITGGAPAGTLRATHLFDPLAETWTRVTDMNRARWYPTTLTLPDGRILAASGAGVADIEIYNAGTNSWQTVAGAARTFNELYPSLHLLPSGQIFYSRAGWAQADTLQTQTAYLTLTGPATGNWTNLAQQQFFDRQEGTTVMQIDTTVSPPTTRLYIVGGGVSGAATSRNPQTAETIELTTIGGNAWTRTPDMNFARTNVNAVPLPDGTILIIGGQRNGKWATDPNAVLEAEIYDPRTNSWSVTAPMMFPRQYHSVAVLLPDGRVLCAGGVDPRPGVVQRDQRNMEIYSPGYLSMGPQPVVSAMPANAAYNANFDIDSVNAADIDSIVLLRPASVTHHTDAGMRYIKLPIVSRTANRLTTRAPANGNIAPPGYYMLYIVNGMGVPSVARFVRIG